MLLAMKILILRIACVSAEFIPGDGLLDHLSMCIFSFILDDAKLFSEFFFFFFWLLWVFVAAPGL